jgi:hypothetical protein
MKIIITEKQLEKLIGEKIKCKCGHSWVKEKNDKHPYLCHMCGWDSKSEKKNLEELLKVWYKKLKED